MIYTHDTGAPLTKEQWDYNFQQLSQRYTLATGEPMPVTLRQNLSRPLTNREADANFQNLDAGIRRLEYGDGPYPVLDQTFVGASFLDPRFTFSRPDSSTYVENGALKTAGANEPIFEDGGLCLWPAATNHAWPSEDFTSIRWTKIRSGVTANAGSAPDGSMRATKLRASLDDNNHGIMGLSPGYPPQRWTGSIFLKAGEYGYAYVWLDDGGGRCVVLEVNLIDGTHRITFTTPANYTNIVPRVIPMADGWWRVHLSATTTLSAVLLRVYCSPSPWVSGNYGTPTFAGDTTSGIHQFGAQINQGDPVPYIPTTSAAVNRSIDNLRIQGAAFSDLFNPIEGAIILDLRNVGSGYVTPWIIEKDGQQGQWYWNQNAANGISALEAWNSGVKSPALQVSAPSISAGGGTAMLAWDATGLNLFAGGKKAPGTIPPSAYDASQFVRMRYLGGAAEFRRLRIFNRRPTDAQLAAWTA